MKFRSLTTIILLAILSIVGIGSVQYFWFKKAFDLKEKQFNQSVFLSLQSVGETILSYNQMTIPADNLVEQISSNYFVVHTNAEIDLKILEHLIRGELTKRNLQFDFEYAVYDCFDDKIIYGNYVNMEEEEENGDSDIIISNRAFPKLENDAQYFGVLFPNKENNLMDQMGIWIFSTIVLILVFTFFGVSIIILFRQKKLSEMQKDFVNNLTHEFKTPLYTIMVTTDLLRQPEIANNQASTSNYLDIISQEAKRLKVQIERILHVATSDKDRISLELEPVNFHDCIKKATEAAGMLLQSKKGKIIFELEADHFVLNADKMHIENVVYNLIENAIKYSEQSPEIRVETFNKDKYVCLTVKDNGIGMDINEVDKIFNKFYRIPTGKTHNVKGFGLGLSYVKDIVLAHKGKINVTSEKNKGSTFVIKLPYLQIEQVEKGIS